MQHNATELLPNQESYGEIESDWRKKRDELLCLLENDIVEPPLESISQKLVRLPPTDFKKTLVFDLDETLIHCVDDSEMQNADAILEIQFSEDESCQAGINFRPHLKECLAMANELF